MTNREHFIATLQACYFGDRNAFEEIIRMYDEKENIIKEVREYIESNPLVYVGDTDVKVEDILYQEKNIEDTKFFETLFEILDKVEEK